MSFSPEIFHRKLDALQETQDSIVLLSQWVLFHHRHAAHLCELWAAYTVQPGAALKKKLLLLYLCNDVVQQARHKRKPEFLAGFAERLPPVLHYIHGSVDEAVQPKVERLISVWNERSVFTKPQIALMRRAVALLKEKRPYDAQAGAAGMAEHATGEQAPAVAPAVAPLNKAYTHMALLRATGAANVAQAEQQAQLYLPKDPSALANLPLPKVYASKLGVLEKLCRMTVQTLRDAQKTRAEIVALLAELSSQVESGAHADAENIAALELKIARALTTRAELLEMIEPESEPEPTKTPAASTNNTGPAREQTFEEPSPAFETSSASAINDSLVPTYEDSSDSDSDAEPARKRVSEEPLQPEPKKRRLSDASNVSVSSKKSVAFSEEIEVKEFERDDQANYMDIIGDFRGRGEDEDADPFPPGDTGFEIRHKDAVELKHERESGADHDLGNGFRTTDQDKSGLMSLLSKLN